MSYDCCYKAVCIHSFLWKGSQKRKAPYIDHMYRSRNFFSLTLQTFLERQEACPPFLHYKNDSQLQILLFRLPPVYKRKPRHAISYYCTCLKKSQYSGYKLLYCMTDCISRTKADNVSLVCSISTNYFYIFS